MTPPKDENETPTRAPADPIHAACRHPEPDLAALVGSRICHDLVSPIGAISNGLELLSMSGPASPELAMVSASCRAALARVRLFRLAFGAPSADQTVSAAELEQDLHTTAEGTRLAHSVLADRPVPRDRALIGLLMAMCAETAMKRNGRITLDLRGSPQVFAAGPEVTLDPGLWTQLQHVAETDRTDPPPASQVHFALLRERLRARKARLRATSAGGRLELALESAG